jgi:protein TonB
MEQPIHFVRGPIAPQQNSRRLIALAVVGVLHVGMIYALAAGLAQQIYQKGIEEIKVAVEQPKIEKAPPPPPPDLAKPPPPYVPPPEINIQMEAPSTNAITTQQKVQVAPPPAVSSPASIGRPHACLQNYPETAVRMNEEGVTTLAFLIMTDGSVDNVTVAQSSGHGDLDDAAVHCASHWKYKPAIQNGQAVQVTWKANVQWTLKGIK